MQTNTEGRVNKWNLETTIQRHVQQCYIEHGCSMRATANALGIDYKTVLKRLQQVGMDKVVDFPSVGELPKRKLSKFLALIDNCVPTEEAAAKVGILAAQGKAIEDFYFKPRAQK